MLIYKAEGRVELESLRYISSPVPLKFKSTYKADKISKTLIRTREIEWVAAPKKYITDHNLELIELKSKKNGRK